MSDNWRHVAPPRKPTWVPIVAIVLIIGLCVLAIGAIVISANHASTAQANDRVKVCSHVEPAAARGACDAGKPLVVTHTKIVTKTAKPTLQGLPTAPVETISGLIALCEKYAAQDLLYRQQNLTGAQSPNASGNNVSAGLGQCLQGVGSLSNQTSQPTAN